MNDPLVTVLMPAYNARRYIKQAVNSVLRQTFRDFELLVYDDASTDGTREILRRFASLDGRLRLVEADKSGYAKLLTRGIEEARGKYIARMDADDVCLPRRLELQVARLEAEPDLVAIGGEVLQVDGQGWAIGTWGVPHTHEEIDRLHITGHAGRMVHPATTFRTSVLRQVGYRSEFEPAEDYDLYLRLAEIGRLANLPETILHYRWHLGNVSITRQREQLSAIRHINDDARRRRGLEALDWSTKPSDVISIPSKLMQMSRTAARSGNRLSALKLFAHLVARHPMSPEARELAIGALRRSVMLKPRPVGHSRKVPCLLG